MNTYFVQDVAGYSDLYVYESATAESAARRWIDDQVYQEEYGLVLKVWEAKAVVKAFVLEQPTKIVLKPYKINKGDEG
ncbi:hypothetical protein LCGC14_1983140 [marine sediment metagenome]|uniref:Uncharacterized protein n=1 Tax=marine sediment metagenome TaxID=412755 RepID=A0A0F9HLI5_9ZZZZ